VRGTRPVFSHITPVLTFMHWIKVKERIEYKHTSHTYEVLTTSQPTIFLNCSLFSLLAVLDPRLLSTYLDYFLISQNYKPFFSTCNTHPTFGINSLILSVSLIHIFVFYFLTTLQTSHHHFHY